jgi:hypothetical protein
VYKPPPCKTNILAKHIRSAYPNTTDTLDNAPGVRALPTKTAESLSQCGAYTEEAHVDQGNPQWALSMQGRSENREATIGPDQSGPPILNMWVIIVGG